VSRPLVEISTNNYNSRKRNFFRKILLHTFRSRCSLLRATVSNVISSTRLTDCSTHQVKMSAHKILNIDAILLQISSLLNGLRVFMGALTLSFTDAKSEPEITQPKAKNHGLTHFPKDNNMYSGVVEENPDLSFRNDSASR
jgi:hypothetical protein